MLDTDVGPCSQVIDRIDDATADSAVSGAGAEIAVFLQRATGKAKEACGFRRAQEAGRLVGGRIGQVTAPAGGGGRRRNCQNASGWVGYEDVRLRGCDPPPRQRAGVGDSADAEQLAVVTFHHGDAITD